MNDDRELCVRTRKEMTVVDIDFDEPRAGPVCVSATAGDVLNFHWDEYHNLFELSNYEDYLGCDFEDATKLANANPTPDGVLVDVATTGDRFFSCSKICVSNGHKVHVCISANADTACECNEPGPSSVPTTHTHSPTLTAGPTTAPTLSAFPTATMAPTVLADMISPASRPVPSGISLLFLFVTAFATARGVVAPRSGAPFCSTQEPL